ncbi:MAG: (Fe-S)-binding protein [Anaerolineaceae bacterium]|nr:MAG: (Fe-S)-binding protein [Anaerolineaceae bacterium]
MAVSSDPKNSSKSESPYFYHVEPIGETGDRAEKFLKAFAAILQNSNYRFIVELFSITSAKCGRCSASCQVYQASGEPRDIPCHRTHLLLDVYRQYFTPGGQFLTRILEGESLSEDKIDDMAECFYRCLACRRCTLECPMGLDHGLITHLGRYILSEAGIAPKGLVVSVREQLEGASGNTSAIPLPALLDNLEFLQDELRDTKGIEVKFPVDQQDAEYIFYPAVSDYLMEADTLMGNAAVLHATGTTWTIGSQYFDGINYGLFYNDWVLERIIEKLVGEAHRLNARKVLVGECGHAARTARQFIPAFAGDKSLPVVSVLDLTNKAIKEGKLKLNPNTITERVTYHDPCNIARSGWLLDPPRQILKSFVKDFVELTPHGKANYCCGGGSGLVSLDETYEFRMKISGKSKAEQLRACGAQIVATPCANCKKQLRELVDFYKLPMQVVGVHDLVLRAMEF